MTKSFSRENGGAPGFSLHPNGQFQWSQIKKAVNGIYFLREKWLEQKLTIELRKRRTSRMEKRQGERKHEQRRRHTHTHISHSFSTDSFHFCVFGGFSHLITLLRPKLWRACKLRFNLDECVQSDGNECAYSPPLFVQSVRSRAELRIS